MVPAGPRCPQRIERRKAQKDTNMGLIYQVAQAPSVSVDLNATGVKLIVPACESVKIVEYGFLSLVTDPGATGVLALQYVDAAGNAVTLDSFTCPTAATVNDLVSQRIDALLDRSGDKYVVSVAGTPGTITAEADGVVAFQLNVTTGFGASVTGIPYVKFALCGTPKTATGVTLVTSI